MWPNPDQRQTAVGLRGIALFHIAGSEVAPPSDLCVNSDVTAVMEKRSPARYTCHMQTPMPELFGKLALAIDGERVVDAALCARLRDEMVASEDERVFVRLSPPITPSDLARLGARVRERFGVELPVEVSEVLGLHDGARAYVSQEAEGPDADEVRGHHLLSGRLMIAALEMLDEREAPKGLLPFFSR